MKDVTGVISCNPDPVFRGKLDQIENIILLVNMDFCCLLPVKQLYNCFFCRIECLVVFEVYGYFLKFLFLF